MPNKIIVCYPIINCQPDDAFYDIILGLDCLCQGCIIDFVNPVFEGRASPGPSYEQDVCFVGHSMKLSNTDVVPQDEWYEYPVLLSATISRLAIHKARRQLVLMDRVTNVIYQFEQLPISLEQRIENDEDRDDVMCDVKTECTSVSILDTFPDATLLCVKLRIAL